MLQSNLKSHKSENTLLQERVKNLETSLADAQITSKGDDASGTTLHTTLLLASIPSVFVSIRFCFHCIAFKFFPADCISAIAFWDQTMLRNTYIL